MTELALRDAQGGIRAAPLKRPRVHEEVINAIAGAIVSGTYPAGGTLPRENDLCKRHGVSRPAIREALKVLESKGLVRCRPRVGTTVLDRDAWNILDAQVLEWLGGSVDKRDLVTAILEARRTIEPVAAAMAAERASLREVAEVEAAWRRMADADGDAVRFSEADVAFHEALLAASHNRIFRQFGMLTESALAFVLKASNESTGDLTEVIRQHGVLVEALRMRDAKAARRAAAAIIDQAVLLIGGP